jgi:hypothetical protein
MRSSFPLPNWGCPMIDPRPQPTLGHIVWLRLRLLALRAWLIIACCLTGKPLVEWRRIKRLRELARSRPN